LQLFEEGGSVTHQMAVDAREKCGQFKMNSKDDTPSPAKKLDWIDTVGAYGRRAPLASMWTPLSADLLAMMDEFDGYWSTWSPCPSVAKAGLSCWNGQRVVQHNPDACESDASTSTRTQYDNDDAISNELRLVEQVGTGTFHTINYLDFQNYSDFHRLYLWKTLLS
jgi:hypothetical protein